MPHSALELYMEKLEKHQAILRMTLGEAAKVPHMKEEDLREWANDIDEKINGGQRKPKIVPRAVLKLVGIGIRK